MNSELKEYLDSFIETFFEQKEVKQYLLLKKQIEDNQDLKELSKKITASQKDLALSIGTPSYLQKKEHYQKLKEEYDLHPLITNFNVIKEEVSSLVNELVRNLKID